MPVVDAAADAATVADAARTALERRVADAEASAERLRERCDALAAALRSAEARADSAAAGAKDTAEAAVREVAAGRRRLEELEGELAALRAAGPPGVMSMFQLPSKQDVLSGLGLEVRCGVAACAR